MKKMLISWFAAALLACPALAAAAVLYVNPAGTWGGGQPAFTTVQQAVDAAQEGDDIWVAQGTYHENVVINKGPVSGAGIKLYGGFSGSETDFGQRDLSTNRTVLDGNKLGTLVRIIG